MIKIIKNHGLPSLNRDIEAGTDEQRRTVLAILEQVKEQGDQALYSLTKKLDHVELTSLCVAEQDIQAAYQFVERETIDIFREAIQNITTFHEQQKRVSWMTTSTTGTMLGMQLRPLER